MEDSEFKYFIISDVSQYLSHELLQNVGLTNIGMDSTEYKEQENIDNSSSETDKIIPKDEKEDDEDGWSIFTMPPLKPTRFGENNKKEIWCDVGVVKATACLVKEFYPTSNTNEHKHISSDNLPDYTNRSKIKIQPGACYKFRVAGINSCNRGEWTDISHFKTCLSDYPKAPSGVKIIQLLCGVRLTWEVPYGSGEILEYLVVLAIKNCKTKRQKSSKTTTTDLHFNQVYRGPNNTAKVSQKLLDLAIIDKTKDPAIIFRISAKNEKGYGSATHVRWLQK